MNTNSKEDLLVAERAAEWLAQMETARPRKRAEFMRWLRRSPVHVREVLLAGTWDAALSRLDPDKKIDIDELMARSAANVVPVRASDDRVSRAKQRRGGRWPWITRFGAVAAAVLIVVVVWSSGTLNLPHPDRFTTVVGEQRVIELKDGSVIHLNTQSRVRVAFSRANRDVYLEKGQAIFKVKHDVTRPFRVRVDRAVIQAIGTQFDVYRRANRIDVAVIEGRVQVSSERPAEAPSGPAAPQRAQIAAGESVSVMEGRITPPATIDVAEASAWQQRRLVFRGSPLEEIVAEYNRYNRTPQIRLEGERLRTRNFSGTYDADDPESLLAALVSEGRIEVDRQSDMITIRPRRDKDVSRNDATTRR